MGSEESPKKQPQPYVDCAFPREDANNNDIRKTLPCAYFQGLWDSHGPPPKRKFPKFTDLAREVGRIKSTLRKKARLRHGALSLIASGSSQKQGLLLAALGKNGHAPSTGVVKASISEGEVDTLVNPQLLKSYFEQAQATADKTAKRPGIPHDTDGAKVDYWLPGVLVIDEIFNALLTTTVTKINAVNKALAAQRPAASQRKAVAGPSGGASYQKALADLEDFVDAIGTGRESGDAAQYVPFINYKAPKPTYIVLVRSEDQFILGAVVHIDDWASGSHSSGSAVP